MKIVHYRVVGTKPVIMHNIAGMEVPDDKVGTKKKRNPAKEAEAGAYRNESGALCLLSIAFRSAILRACMGRKIGKFNAGAIISGSVLTVEELLPLVHPETGQALREYEIYTASVVVNRVRVPHSRPRIHAWACDLPLEVDEEMLPNLQNLTDLLNIAGKMVGVGDWRPEKKGIHGRFAAELVAG